MNASITFRRCLLGLGIAMLALSTQAGNTDIAQTPLIVATPNAVQPNLMFVLDDSGSMSFDFMPDHVAGNGTGIYPKQCRTTGATSNNSGSFNTTCCQGGDSSNVCLSGTAPSFGNKRPHPPFLSASYNTMAYNPATFYKPPINSNGDSWPSMTEANTNAWRSVPDDAYRVQTSSNTNLVSQFPDVSWCTNNSYTKCLRNGNYVLPGKVGTDNYTVYLATSASGSGSKAVGSPDNPTMVGQEWGPHYYNIIPGEYCTKADLRNCRVGQNATYTFPAPVRWCNSAANAAAAVANGSCQAVRTNTYQYARYPTRHLSAASTFPGSFERVDIVSTRDAYPKAASRIDCGGESVTICNYEQEMTNFANWWAYYRTRMQMMKSSTSHAFGAVTSAYRVGYLTINNAQSNGFLNLKTFSDGDKSTWYTRLFAAKPSGATPLRAALQTVGQLYAGKRTGSLNGSAIVDPIQYSCQGNYTILSTDGFWNESVTLKKLDGTNLGDQDGGLDRPMKDGNSTPNTLADAAAYYYRTDLRDGSNGVGCTSGSGTDVDVCSNGTENSKPQKMTTFTLGLGASGYMQFLPGYQSAIEGDYHAVKNGAIPNAAAGICTWQTSGQCTWPTPVSNELTTIDDLWHAAINGGGAYFSARDPDSLYTGLTTALASIEADLGASAAATTSNPNISAGNNQIFLSNFVSGEWSGELTEQRIDPNNGTTGAASWSASALLDGRASRTIYMFDASVASKRKSFEWGTLSASEKANFLLPHVTAAGRALTQFCNFGAHCLSAADQSAAAGAPLLSFLRGDRSNEGAMNDPSKFFRARAHVLGDIVNSEAVYVNKPQLNLVDAGYETFKASPAITGRPGMVYVGANDGMLHAFVAATGEEAWAYVPTAVLPKLYKLANKTYANNHEYYVDGSPVVEDVPINGQWRTMLVAGLGAGGRAYYALDVTDPTNPKPLWEFSHANLGLTFGKPEIAKLANGRWVVIVPSGYNNNVPPGDGVGRLFVLDASTGQPVAEMPNGIKTTAGGADVGSVDTPSGLGHIRTWVDNADRDNTVLRVYGGDTLGNLWRFDVNNTIGAAGYDAQRLATLKNAGGFAQPITSRPEVGEVPGANGRNHAMVFVGTGRYLGASDIDDSTVQSIYGIKDRLNDSDYLNPRAATNAFVKQTLVSGTCPENSTICTEGIATRNVANPLTVDLEVNDGWYVDLPVTRERVNTDPSLVQGVLAVVSNVADASAMCKVGGSSWLNYFDYRSGAAAPSANTVVSLFLGDAISTRPIVVRLPNNELKTFTRLTDGRTVQSPQPTRTRNAPADRISWRELSGQ